MAFTRKMLKGAGIEEDKIDFIMDAHLEVVEGFKSDIKELESKAAENEEAAKELANLRANPGDDYKAKYEAEKKSFEDYKNDMAAKAKKQEVEQLYREQLEELGITGKRAASILKATDLSSFEVANGEFKNAKAVAEAIKADWGEFIPKTTTEGAKVATPPANGDGMVTAEQFKKMSYAERVQLYESDRETYDSLIKEQ